jgi:hypothetical protein
LDKETDKSPEVLAKISGQSKDIVNGVIEQLLHTLQTSDEETNSEKSIKMKMVHRLVDKSFHECNLEEDMVNEVVNDLITGVVKLILLSSDGVVLRESDVFETAEVLFSDTVTEETKNMSPIMEAHVTEQSQTHQDVKCPAKKRLLTNKLRQMVHKWETFQRGINK